jgi:hypothetical protein
MKWTLIGNTASDIREYHLIQDGHTLVVMKYSPEQQTVRIAHEGERLVFFMENAGYAHRVIFKNVYGVGLGKFSHNSRNNLGRLEIDKEIFDYNIVDGSLAKLIVHQHNRQEPLAICQIPDDTLRQASIYEQAGMVLSVCSFTKAPATKKNLNI